MRLAPNQLSLNQAYRIIIAHDPRFVGRDSLDSFCDFIRANRMKSITQTKLFTWLGY